LTVSSGGGNDSTSAVVILNETSESPVVVVDADVVVAFDRLCVVFPTVGGEDGDGGDADSVFIVDGVGGGITIVETGDTDDLAEVGGGGGGWTVVEVESGVDGAVRFNEVTGDVADEDGCTTSRRRM